MSGDALKEIPVLLEKIRSEIAINEVYLKGKVDETRFITVMAELEKDLTAKHNKLLIKVAVIAGIVGGGAGLLS